MRDSLPPDRLPEYFSCLHIQHITYKYILLVFVLHMTSVFVLIIKITIIMLSVFDVWIVHLPAGRQSRPRARLRCHCRGGDGQVRSKLCHWPCWLGKVPRLRTDFVKMFLTPAFQMQLSSQILCLTTIYVSLASMARRLERLHLSNHLCLSQHCPAFS